MSGKSNDVVETEQSEEVLFAAFVWFAHLVVTSLKDREPNFSLFSSSSMATKVLEGNTKKGFRKSSVSRWILLAVFIFLFELFLVSSLKTGNGPSHPATMLGWWESQGIQYCCLWRGLTWGLLPWPSEPVPRHPAPPAPRERPC